jgi:hypothetical protein
VSPAASSLRNLSGARFTLPVSGLTAVLRQPTGMEDLLLLETPDDDAAVLGLAEVLATAEDGGGIDWPQLTPTDLDVFILRFRQAWLGDHIASRLICRGEGCASRIDLSFGIEAYLAFHRPKVPRRRHWLAISTEPPWFRLSAIGDGDHAENTSRFRLPTMVDLMAAKRQRNPQRALAGACLFDAGMSAQVRRRMEAAMTAMAPPLASELQGTCPDCGATITAHFEPRSYCLRELRERARFVHEDIDVLASRYHWPEESILAMPVRRRQSYVEWVLSRMST